MDGKKTVKKILKVLKKEMGEKKGLPILDKIT